MKPKKPRNNYAQPTNLKENEFELVISKDNKEKIKKNPTPLNQLEISVIKHEAPSAQSLSQSVKRSNTNPQNEKQKNVDKSYGSIKNTSTANKLIYDPQLIKIRKFMEKYQGKIPLPLPHKDEDKGVPIENEVLPKKIYVINEKNKSTQPALVVKRGFVINTVRTEEESKLPEKKEIPKNNVKTLKSAKPKPKTKPEPKTDIRQSHHIEIEYTNNKPKESNITPIIPIKDNLNTENSHTEHVPKYQIKHAYTTQRTYDDDIIVKTQKILNSSKEKEIIPNKISTFTSQYETIQSEPVNNINFRESPKRLRSVSEVKRMGPSPLKINPTPTRSTKPTPTYSNEDNLFYIYSNKELYDKLNYNNWSNEVCPSTTIPTYKRRNIYLSEENENIFNSNNNAYIPSKYKKFNETSKTEYNGVSPSYSLRNQRPTNLYGNVGNLYRNAFIRVKYENEGYNHFNHPNTVRKNRNYYRYMEPLSVQINDDYNEENDDNLCYRCKQKIKQRSMMSTISY